MKTNDENPKRWREALRASWEADAPTSEDLSRLWGGVEARAAKMLAADRARRPVPSPWATAMHLHLRAATAIFLFAVAGVTGSVSAAAEGSLPGDFLYPVKIHVNDFAIEVAAVTAEGNARAKVALVERRTEEIAALADEGRLDAEAIAEISDNIQAHAEEIVTEVLADETRDEDHYAAVEVVSEELAAAIDKSAEAIAMVYGDAEVPTENATEAADEGVVVTARLQDDPTPETVPAESEVALMAAPAEEVAAEDSLIDGEQLELRALAESLDAFVEIEAEVGDDENVPAPTGETEETVAPAPVATSTEAAATSTVTVTVEI